ncbi:MAG TPA: MFS transporter [Thermomicrobiales bacterium]|nr:MFS transporter [Thermomicrobiales bacterium]
MIAGLRARGVRLYYGWVIAGTLAATETISWGILFYAFSVFLVPMQAELGWSSGELTGAYSLGLLIAGLAALPVGRWLDRHGPRSIMTAGSILGTGLLLAWATVDDLTVFYLIWAAMGLAMAATLYEPAFAVIAVWFERDRGRAMLLLTFFAGLASTIFLPVATWLVEALGWRQALVALAIFLGATTIPAHALLLRRRPEDLGLQPDGVAYAQGLDLTSAPVITGTTLREALHAAAFWWLSIAFSLGTLASVAIGVHLIPYLLELGYDAGFAAIATGLIGATQVVARVLVSLVGDRWPQVAVTTVVFALQGAAFIILLGWNQPAGVLLAVILLGAGRGATTLTRAGLVAELYGRAHYGAIGGTLALFLTGSRAVAPVGAGVAYGWRDGYGPVLWGLAVASMLAALAMIGVPGWRR